MDFSATKNDYSIRPNYPPNSFRRLQDMGVGTQGQDVLDIGTGTGSIARRLAENGCRVVGVDVSKDLIEIAQKLDLNANVRVESGGPRK